jgi:mannan endo-1,4-beta-mannosidase
MTHVLPSRYATAVIVLALLTVATTVYVSPLDTTSATSKSGSSGKQARIFKPLVVPLTVPKKSPASVSSTTATGQTASFVASAAATRSPRPLTVAPAPTPTTPSTTIPATTTTTPTIPPYVPPVPSSATMAALEHPATTYFGVANANIPFNSAAFNTLDQEVGKAPSTVEWFDGWDTSFPAAAVTSAWQHRALPIITWESMPSIDPVTGQSRAADPAYSLSNIINGVYDAYILKFAAAVAAADVPVAIRFDQEMNGNWYPWAEDANGNSPGQFVTMWRHVWNIFNEVGANQDVIWLWAPNRVDKLASNAPSLSELYPGNQYVNWMGMDGYYRYEGDPTSFAFTFGRTLTQLSAISSTTPIFLAEVGAAETGPTGDSLAAAKAAWTTNLFSGIQANHQIVGFSWFDNMATNNVDGQLVQDNWQFDGDPQSLAAFQAGAESSAFAGGLILGGSS